MAERGIIFSAPMVRALLEGRKTQTRRLLSLRGYPNFSLFGPSPTDGYDWHFRRADQAWCDFRHEDLPLPHSIGDRLYVREAHTVVGAIDPGWVLYRASGYEAECKRHGFDNPPPENEVRWTPSIHMPRWASRLTLTVTDVRVQQLQEISRDDCVAEGHPRSSFQVTEDVHLDAARDWFMDLWDSLHKDSGTRWTDNPWLYALTFDVQHGNIDQVQA